MWGYYWAYTSAQVELLAADCPIVVYGKPKRRPGKKGGTKASTFNDVSATDVREAANKWREKYGKDNGKGNGVKVSLEGLKMLGRKGGNP